MPYLQTDGFRQHYRVDGLIRPDPNPPASSSEMLPRLLRNPGDAEDVLRRGRASPPLLMLGGLTQPLWSYFLQVRDLRRHFTTIRLDNRGAGTTAAPRGPYTMAQMVEDALRLLDHLRVRRCHVLGVSMGGMIAQQIALDHPGRVERLVLFSTTACLEPPQRRESTRRFSRSRLAGLPGLRGPLGQMGAIAGHDTRARLGEIRAPTLILVGEQDPLTPPREAAVMARGIPGSTLVRVPEATHLMLFEKWRECNLHIIRFLESR